MSGLFRVKPRFYTSPLLTTIAQCTATATALLTPTTGMHSGVNLTILVNPAFDAGDVLLVRCPDAANLHIIDTLTVPLSPRDTRQSTTRSLELPAEA